MPKRLEINVGDVFNRIKVLRELEPEIQHCYEKITPIRHFEFLCYCGTIFSTRLVDVISGRCKSCGCWKIQRARIDQKRFITHGLYHHPLRGRWANIKQRCYDKGSKRYMDYGGRGIVMCDEWKNDFMTFYEWSINNGWEKRLEIDRINNDGNYCPENCRWTTRKENCDNTRRTIYVLLNGVKTTLTKACIALGISVTLIRGRMYKGLSFDDAVNKKMYSKIIKK